KIKRSRTGGDESHSPLFVHGHTRPAVRAADVLPGVGRPGLVTRLARIRNCVERPDELAGARVVSADVSGRGGAGHIRARSEEHTSELQSRRDLVCRLLLEKKKKRKMRE